LGLTGFGSKGDGHLLENWLGLVRSLWLEGGVNQFGGLEEVVVGLDVT